MNKFKLDGNNEDIEKFIGFASKKYTGVNNILSLLLGVMFTLLFYAALYPFWLSHRYQMVDMFFHGGEFNRSTIPYYTVFLAAWACAILIIKNQKVKMQQRAFALEIVPQDPAFVLSAMTASDILKNIHNQVYMPKRYVLFNRMERALSNLKNIGRVSDVSSLLSVQAENDEQYFESTYTLLKGFIWGIPVLGFIGTVLGLSQAVGGFGAAVTQGADISKLKNSLTGVTGGLAVAFETTLIALVAAFVLQLWMTLVRKREEDFLDECSDYCHRNIISKLKILNVAEEYQTD
jgi:biopolymer transport protein ExbB/TolQ